MIKKYLLSLLLLGTALASTVAQVNLDSLRNVLPYTHDTNRVDVLNQLARWSLPDKVKSSEYATQALEAGKALNYARGLAYTYFTYGLIYLEYAKYDSAFYYTNQALKIAKNNNFTQYIGFCYNSLGEIHHNQGNYLAAIESYVASEKIKTQINDIKGLAATSYNIATLNLKIKNYAEAERYINRCYELSKQRAGSSTKSAIILRDYSIGQVRLAQKKYKEAANLIEKAINESKAAKFSADFIEKMLSPLGKAYAGAGQQERALPILLGSVDYFKKKGFAQEATEDLLVIADIYQQQGNLTEAVKIAGDAVNTSKNIKDVDLVHAASEKYAQLLGEMGEYKDAYENQLFTNKMQDSVFNVEKSKEFNRLQTAYEVEKKENAIKLLTQENQLHQAEKERQQLLKNITVIGLVITIIFIFLIYNRYKDKQKSNLQLQQKQEIIQKTNHQLQGLLVEKDLLLREIHHRVKNNLQIIESLLRTQTEQFDNPEVHIALQQSQTRIHTIAAIHHLLYGSGNVAKIEMQSYITALTDYFENALAYYQKIRFELHIAPVELNPDFAMPIGLILNEAITNSIKYAFPDHIGKIFITLRQMHDQELELIIADDGIGLPPTFDLQKDKSMGMRLIFGLARQIHSTVTIEKQPGCKIHLLIPTTVFTPEITPYQKRPVMASL